MRIKSKNGLKVVIIAVALLLCLALAVGITGAWYQAKRQATGTLSMDQGIIIDYKGFGKTPDEGIWTRETTTTFLLFNETNAQPGEQITVNAAGIRANEKSVDFYARVKLSYKFYNVVKSATEGEQDTENVVYDSNATTGNVEGFKPSDLITTSANFFGINWVESGDGYYYYGSGTTLNKFNKGTQTFVNLFATDAKFVIEGEGFKGATSDGEGGGFVVGDTSINKIEVYLTLETLQGGTGSAGGGTGSTGGGTGSEGGADVETEGWKITTATGETENEKVIELTPGDYTTTTTTDDTTGEEKTIYTPSETFVGKNPKYAFTFSLNDTDKTATITGPVGKPAELDIPNKIIVKEQNYTTTSIGKNAFEDCSSLTSITMPNSLTSIGKWGFSWCESLTSIKIPDRVESIGKWAFSHCTGLKSITIPDRVESIGDGVFNACSGLTSVIIGQNVASIGEYTFSNCSSLTLITIPNSVISIERNAFSVCNSLTSIAIPNSVNSIGIQAFAACNSLTSVKIGNSVNSIGGQAFSDCSSLEKIEVVQGNTKYSSVGNCLIETGSNTLIAGCKNSVIPADGSVTSIGSSAFHGCEGLTSINIPDSVTSIGNGAFQICRGLTSITIPDSVKNIGSYVFHSCNNLTTTIGDGWVKVRGNTPVNANTLLRDISYDIKRA